MKTKKMTIQEIRFDLMGKTLIPVFLKEVTECESRIIDSYRLVNKDKLVDFFKEIQDQTKVFNVLINEKKILIWDERS